MLRRYTTALLLIVNLLTLGVVATGQAPQEKVDLEVINKMKDEGFTRITWEIVPTKSGFCRLTVTHELEGAPIMASMVGSPFSEQGAGGWSWILSDMKSLLETGAAMA